MSVRSAQSITVVFTTRRFDTGAATNADSTPTGTLYVNGTADAASVTVTNITTGVYKAAVTLPTLAVNDVVDLRIAATVNSVADNAVVWRDTKDMFAGVLPDVVAGGSGGLVISGSNTGTTTFGALTVTGATTLTGAVSLGSTLGVTGTTTLAALTTTGTVTMNALTVTNATTLTGAVSLGNNLTITGTVSAGVFTVTGTMTVNALTISTTLGVGTTTTFTGAVLAINASNDIRGIDVKSISGDATAADNAEAFFDGTGYAGTNNVIPTVTTVTNQLSSATIAAAVLTTQMTESYRSAGTAPTLAQAAFELIAGVLDHSISGTTKTIRNIAGTAAKTYTLDSSTAPTSITEAT